MAATKVFVNLPVKDLERSKAFYQALGYTINPRFTDENAACVVFTEDIYAMILTEPFFKSFTSKQLVDAKRSIETMVSISCASRDAVDRIVRKALASGGHEHGNPKDHGFMYEWGFEDPDGHVWSYFWMDPKAAEDGPPA